ncbi:hypothetical protein BegalDRAFT_1957 [Beggiatoa alba B18LD]|uniref:DUF4426 domain-containing protein n=1 Tax=Beggiatoa alba B18LD TaxID=395493 RepID=I3CGT6_9GAMM|nr:DUF4426 domain-containing protein [Beggiatoa alba]EIJ42829.1 hypothetical protein BegalDRAFT_1957 [Beggiatoa alba B18LD]
MRVLIYGFYALLLLTVSVKAEQAVFGDYVVHYAAIPTVAIPEEMAKKYQIMQGAHYGLLNVSVFQTAKEGADKAVFANISATMREANGKEQEILLRLVQETGISYVGVFPFREGASLTFTLMVDPNLQGTVQQITFSQSFFSD